MSWSCRVGTEIWRVGLGWVKKNGPVGNVEWSRQSNRSGLCVSVYG